MHLIRPGPGGWKTVRAAIQGWGPTLRLLAIMMAATICVIALQFAIRM